MAEREIFYGGSLRISNPKTLQKWIDKGWYKKELDNGYIFNIGCGRFRNEKCNCSDCRKKKRLDLSLVIERNKLEII